MSNQCVVVATRPLVLSILKERLEKLGQAEEDWHTFLMLPKSLISIGIKSAVKTLQILSDEDTLLGRLIPSYLGNCQVVCMTDKDPETFLPFDLEFAYAAALHLTMANSLFPSTADDQMYSQIAHSILDEMIFNGNKVAEARKVELIRIESLFRDLAKRVQQEGLQVLTLSGPEAGEVGLVYNSHGEHQGQESVTGPEAGSHSTEGGIPQCFQEPSVPANVDALGHVGISSCEFLSILEEIDHPGIPYDVLYAGPEWLEG